MKKIIVFLVVCISLVTLSSAVMAKELTITEEAHDAEESRLKGDGTSAPKEIDWEFIVGDGPTARYMCDYCGFMTASVCSADSTYLSTGSHKPLFGETCVVDYYGSRGAEMCQYCKTVQWYYNGNHLCWEYHSSCSKGWYDVCPMEVS